MASFNKVILIGNLTADPELKQTAQGTSVCRFSIAVNRRVSKQNADPSQPTVDFFTIIAWRERAEFVSKYFRKGRPILVCGQIQNRNWTDNQGVKHYATEIVADELSFVENKSASDNGAQQNGNYAPDAYGTPGYQNGNAPEFEEVQGDDNLPF